MGTTTASSVGYAIDADAGSTLGTRVREREEVRQLLVASEYGEPGNWKDIVQSRLHKLATRGEVALLLITKNPERSFDIVQKATEDGVPTQVHFTITGLGGTKYEPQIPSPQSATESALRWIQRGFIEPEAVTLRIDPIVPEFIHIQREVWPGLLDAFANTGVVDVRCSVVDYYPHVRERFRSLGMDVSVTFQTSRNTIVSCIDSLVHYSSQLRMKLHLCAEETPGLTRSGVDREGCASSISWTRLGVTDLKPLVRRQRPSCTCDLEKSDLLKGLRKGCPDGCVYCYWR